MQESPTVNIKRKSTVLCTVRYIAVVDMPLNPILSYNLLSLRSFDDARFERGVPETAVAFGPLQRPKTVPPNGEKKI